jgi:hypothetical protein
MGGGAGLGAEITGGRLAGAAGGGGMGFCESGFPDRSPGGFSASAFASTSGGFGNCGDGGNATGCAVEGGRTKTRAGGWCLHDAAPKDRIASSKMGTVDVRAPSGAVSLGPSKTRN